MHAFQIAEECKKLLATDWQEFESRIQQLYTESNDDIILDFSGIEEINSHVLAILDSLQVSLREDDHSLIIRGLNHKIKLLLEITGLADNLVIEEPGSITQTA